MVKPHNRDEEQKREIEIEIVLIDKKSSYITRALTARLPTEGV